MARASGRGTARARARARANESTSMIMIMIMLPASSPWARNGQMGEKPGSLATRQPSKLRHSTAARGQHDEDPFGFDLECMRRN